MANTGTEKLDRAAGLQESYFKCFSDGFGLCLNQRVRRFEKALQGWHRESESASSFWYYRPPPIVTRSDIGTCVLVRPLYCLQERRLGHAEQWPQPEWFCRYSLWPSEQPSVKRGLAFFRDGALRPWQNAHYCLDSRWGRCHSTMLCCPPMCGLFLLCVCVSTVLWTCAFHLHDYDRLADCVVPQASGPSSALVPLLQHHRSQEHGGHMSAITFLHLCPSQIWVLKFFLFFFF